MLDTLFRRTSCPLPSADRRPACVRPRHFLPLVAFVLPTLVIGYGFVLPRHGLGDVNELSVGFGTTVLGATITYVVGVLGALRR